MSLRIINKLALLSSIGSDASERRAVQTLLTKQANFLSNFSSVSDDSKLLDILDEGGIKVPNKSDYTDNFIDRYFSTNKSDLDSEKGKQDYALDLLNKRTKSEEDRDDKAYNRRINENKLIRDNMLADALLARTNKKEDDALARSIFLEDASTTRKNLLEDRKADRDYFVADREFDTKDRDALAEAREKHLDKAESRALSSDFRNTAKSLLLGTGGVLGAIALGGVANRFIKNTGNTTGNLLGGLLDKVGPKNIGLLGLAGLATYGGKKYLDHLDAKDAKQLQLEAIKADQEAARKAQLYKALGIGGVGIGSALGAYALHNAMKSRHSDKREKTSGIMNALVNNLGKTVGFGLGGSLAAYGAYKAFQDSIAPSIRKLRAGFNYSNIIGNEEDAEFLNALNDMKAENEDQFKNVRENILNRDDLNYIIKKKRAAAQAKAMEEERAQKKKLEEQLAKEKSNREKAEQEYNNSFSGKANNYLKSLTPDQKRNMAIGGGLLASALAGGYAMHRSNKKDKDKN